MVVKGYGQQPHMTPPPPKKAFKDKSPISYINTCRFFFSMNKGDRVLIGEHFERKGGHAIQQIFSLSYIEESTISRKNLVKQRGYSIQQTFFPFTHCFHYHFS